MEIQGETQKESVLRAKRTVERIWEENKNYFAKKTVSVKATSSFAARKTILQCYLEDAEQDHSAFLRRMGFQRNKILFLLAEKYLRQHNIQAKTSFATNLFNVIKSSEASGETIDVFRVEGCNSKDKNTDIFRCCFAVEGNCDSAVRVELSTFPKNEVSESTTITAY